MNLKTFLLAALAFASGCAADDGERDGEPRASEVEPVARQLYPDTLDLPFRSIPELLMAAPDSGRFNTRGFVIGARPCPPCWPGAACSPCNPADPHVALATGPGATPAPEPWDERPDQFTVHVRATDGFEVGRPYAVSVEVVPGLGSGLTHDVPPVSSYTTRLLGYTALPTP